MKDVVREVLRGVCCRLVQHSLFCDETDTPAVTMPVYVPLRVTYLPLNVTSGIKFSVNCSAVLATTAQKGHSFLNHVYQQAYVCISGRTRAHSSEHRYTASNTVQQSILYSVTDRLVLILDGYTIYCVNQIV